MVEPVGYVKLWQKFENEVYYTVKNSLETKYRVEWSHQIKKYTPDVAVMVECHSCQNRVDEFPCNVPIFLFDAYCKFKIEKNYFEKKNDQMKKYSKICDSILVMPQGYEQRPYCKSKEGEYHIISFLGLRTLLLSINSDLVVDWQDDVCGTRPFSSAKGVFRNFELSLRSSVDKCPMCSSRVSPISLIHCTKYDEYYHPEYLDHEFIRYSSIPTYSECDGCGDRNLFGYDYSQCAFSHITHKYQCRKCGVFFDPESKKIIERGNLFDGHLESMELPYYEE